MRTVSRKENDGIPNNPVQLSCIRYTFPMTCNGHNVSYTVRTEGRIMSYVTFIEYKGTRIDIPQEYIKVNLDLADKQTRVTVMNHEMYYKITVFSPFCKIHFPAIWIQ